MASQRITEIKNCKVYQGCENDPNDPTNVFLRWFSADGGENVWLFHTRQERGLNIDTVAIINHPVDDLATATRERDVYKKEVDPNLIVGADQLEDDDMAGIESLLYSTRVEMLVSWDQLTAPVWRTVVVLPGSYSTQMTDHVFHEVELTISLPQINTQAQ